MNIKGSVGISNNDAVNRRTSGSGADYSITAILLGNGFDIANNFKTSYCDFVESDYFKSLLVNDNALAKHIYSVKQLYNWVDVEIELGKYSFTLEETTAPENQRKIANILFAEYTALKKALYQYINSMRSSLVNPKMEALVDKWLNYTLPDNNTKLFIVNFNYNLWDHIRFFNHAIRENLITGQPLHIHGITDYLVPDSENIVLGVDDKSVRGASHNFIVKAFDNLTRDKEYFNNIHSATKYIIFGCSIGGTDIRYFKPIFDNSKNKEFEIYGYGAIGLADVQSNIAKICNFDEFKANNNVSFLDSSIYS